MLNPLLVAVLLWWQPERPPLPMADDIIAVPRSWLLGEERSTTRVRKAHIVALLGRPDGIYGGGWLTHWSYRCGIWVIWETPALYVCPGERLGHRVAALLRAWLPGGLRPVARLLGARLTPAESLLEVGWAGCGLRLVWRFEK